LAQDAVEVSNERLNFDELLQTMDISHIRF